MRRGRAIAEGGHGDRGAPVRQERRHEILILDAGKRIIAGYRDRAVFGGFGRALDQLGVGHIEAQGLLIAGRVGYGQIAEAAAPFDLMRKRLAARRHFRRNLQQVAGFPELEGFVGHYAAIGIIEADGQAVSIGVHFVERLVEVHGRLLRREVERRGRIGMRCGIDQLQRRAAVLLVFLQQPALHHAAAIAEGDLKKIGIDSVDLFLLRGNRRSGGFRSSAFGGDWHSGFCRWRGGAGRRRHGCGGSRGQPSSPAEPRSCRNTA